MRLEWQAASGAASYSVRRADTRDFSAPLVVGSADGTLFEDANALTQGGLHLYRIVTVDACGNDSDE